MKIALLGDIALFGRFCVTNNKDIFNQLLSVKQYLSSFDYVVGNLETPFSENEKPVWGKSATIKSHPENISVLKWLGITHVTLANNHMGDFGITAFERTKGLLESKGIDWYGAENKNSFIRHSDGNIALQGYCSYNTNPSNISFRKRHGLNYLDLSKALKDLQYHSSLGYLNIISVHSGQEHVHLPSIEDITFARLLAEEMNYIYHGHHPHVIQGHEQWKSSDIFYSLGNFLFDDVYTNRDLSTPLITLSEENKTGAIAEIEVFNNKVKRSCITPIYIASDKVLVGDVIKDFRISSFNEYLSMAGSSQYNDIREVMIKKYIKGHYKKSRNLRWYLSRLNTNSIGIILKALVNKRLYDSAFRSKLTLLDGKK